MTPQLTRQEIEKMRQIVLAHDKASFGGMKEFDLNNPPREPYRYRPFPKCIYHHGSDTSKVIGSLEATHEENQAVLEQHLAQGWSTDPTPPAESDAGPALDAATQAEVAALDAEARKPRKQK